MSFLLAFLSLLVELCFGYPDRLLRAIGHPVIWIGSLISFLDRTLNRAEESADMRKFASARWCCCCLSPLALWRRTPVFVPAPRRRPDGDRREQPACPAQPRQPCRRRCAGAGDRRAGGRPQGGIADRRTRSGAAGRSRRQPGDPEPRREFFRRHRRAGLLARHRRARCRSRLQGRQHRRFHDRPPHAAPRGFRLGGRALRRSDQPARLALALLIIAAALLVPGAEPAAAGARCAATRQNIGRPTRAGRNWRWPVRSVSRLPVRAPMAA